MNKISKGMLLATAAMVLVTSNTFATTADTTGTSKPIKCHGINSCRGKAQCGSKNSNSCAGQNACKGKGWVYVSPEQCQKQGGTIVK